MKVIDTEIEGVFIVENFHVEDERGAFVKTYHENDFAQHGLCTDFRESFYSVSNKDTIRGMHFQLPPFDHDKLIYVVGGAIEDVLLDLRKSSVTYGLAMSIHMDTRQRISLYVPKGIAHGFKALRNDTIVIYQVSSIHSAEYDDGIRYDSFGHDWKLINPCMSKRDEDFQTFEAFKSINPF